MKAITYQKAGINFKFTFERGTAFFVEAENLYETGDSEYNQPDKKVGKLHAGYKEGIIKLTFGGYILVNGQKITGIKIEDLGIQKQMENLISDSKKEWDDNKADREANRIAPYLNEEKYVTYSIGCDTGLIYSEEIRPIIKLALKNGIKPTPVYRGQRDNTNKYPGQMDSMIPAEYVTKTKKGATAVGYEYVTPDWYCIPIDDFNAAKAIIDAELNQKKEEADKALQEAFEKARTTGEPVLISKITVDEKDSPLAGDGEDDMVDICKFAMPDGTIQEKCFHNY